MRQCSVQYGIPDAERAPQKAKSGLDGSPIGHLHIESRNSRIPTRFDSGSAMSRAQR